MSEELRIPETSLAWLRSRIFHNAQVGDLASTYAFAHHLNSARTLTKSLVEDDASLLYHIEFRTSDDVLVLDYPLARRIRARERLWGQPSLHSSVADKVLLRLAERFKKQQFARALYESEDELYLRWGIREIHIDAHWEGRSVWIKSFGYVPKDPELLELDYPGWARQRQRPTTPPAMPKDYPEEFLQSRSQLLVYKVLRP